MADFIGPSLNGTSNVNPIVGNHVMRWIFSFALIAAAPMASMTQASFEQALCKVISDEASMLPNQDRLCVSVLARDPSVSLRKALERRGVRTLPISSCLHPPSGVVIAVRSIKREPDHLDIHVESGDMSIPPGEHFATLLRHGVYRLKQSHGEWTTVEYLPFPDGKTR